MNYNESRFKGFVPKSNSVAKRSPRPPTKEVKLGEPSTRLPPKPENREILDGEMAERELAALAEAERRKLCCAPAYNKGAYQYISSEEQAKDIGR